MTMTPVYFFTVPGNDSVKISQDQLRSLLSEIETELHSSKVYLIAMNTLQNLLGSSGESINILLKAVGREAISLAFQQLLQSEKVIENHHVSPTVVSETPTNSTTMQLEPQTSKTDITPDQISTETTENIPIKSPEKALKNLFQRHKKSPEPEIKQPTLAEQRLEIMSSIGQKLKQARESKGLSLYQLNVYTHIPIHRMEAIENSDFELLPEDTLVRGFIRSMGNAVGLNGTNLAASLPANSGLPSLTRSWNNSTESSEELGIALSPIHLYLGYTTLIAGAVGGLSLTSQPVNSGRIPAPDVVTCPSSSLSQPFEMSAICIKPGLIDSNIAPPETF
ncbi:helix-turn-helix domain-containing protein [Nodularia harveyana UHCC-0300]|uniref:Helix-turn-helix domain-containing protein n=1 Tax=Nodularia harveyana UHCC-0300 TaxID=2974287 RepID=A0ABU5UET7_9CYAN|nr:helix-turn-helix domain-containing protein [Nodularia harveyana]MEA5581679.1 helix-turn-helix domain-containing protein [Nodularia harveyana UHCC-0300]